MDWNLMPASSKSSYLYMLKKLAAPPCPQRPASRLPTAALRGQTYDWILCDQTYDQRRGLQERELRYQACPDCFNNLSDVTLRYTNG